MGLVEGLCYSNEFLQAGIILKMKWVKDKTLP